MSPFDYTAPAELFLAKPARLRAAISGPRSHARHSTGYAWLERGMDTRRLQHFLGQELRPIALA
jgi:hypothetical protein